jgi:hypothetical protein
LRGVEAYIASIEKLQASGVIPARKAKASLKEQYALRDLLKVELADSARDRRISSAPVPQARQLRLAGLLFGVDCHDDRATAISHRTWGMKPMTTEDRDAETELLRAIGRRLELVREHVGVIQREVEEIEKHLDEELNRLAALFAKRL